jgi:hypothetical protein
MKLLFVAEFHVFLSPATAGRGMLGICFSPKAENILKGRTAQGEKGGAGEKGRFLVKAETANSKFPPYLIDVIGMYQPG